MTETFVTSDGVRLWTIVQGSGVPIVLCNGGPGCCDYLAPLAAMLNDLAQVIRFEARGCGRSDQVPPYTVATCLADLEAIRQHYRVERWIVTGHSWGADLALAYALGYPERVHGFVCISGGRVNNDREWHRIYSERRDQGLETLPAFDYPPNLEVNAEVGRSWKQYIQRPSLLKEIARLDRPALFLYGDRDIRPSWPIEQVAQLLPNAALTMIAGADHHIWVTHAEAMRAPLRAFVQRMREQAI
ncbi:MAG: alpha/beta fold hydrolase [Candidatus Competibacteraceae bacterium]